MKYRRQTNTWAAILALLPNVHYAIGATQITFEDAFTHGLLSVEVGSAGSEYTLSFHTGSSNTWVGADRSFIGSSTTRETTNSVSVNYGDGLNMVGTEYIDRVGLNGDLAINNQSIGVATSSNGFQGMDGVLGLGPAALTAGTVANTDEVPTVLDNLYSEGTIQDRIMHISQQAINFGGVDSTLLVGSNNYVPITSSAPASDYWGIDAGFVYDEGNLMDAKPGIIDYGQSTISMESNAYRSLLVATGATTDEATGLPVLDSCDGLKPLTMKIGNKDFNIPVSQYTWPQDQNIAIGGQADKCYLGVVEMPNGDGIDFILGYNTLKHLNIILDATNSQVGFVGALLDV